MVLWYGMVFQRNLHLTCPKYSTTGGREVHQGKQRPTHTSPWARSSTGRWLSSKGPSEIAKRDIYWNLSSAAIPWFSDLFSSIDSSLLFAQKPSEAMSYISGDELELFLMDHKMWWKKEVNELNHTMLAGSPHSFSLMQNCSAKMKSHSACKTLALASPHMQEICRKTSRPPKSGKGQPQHRQSLRRILKPVCQTKTLSSQTSQSDPSWGDLALVPKTARWM